MRKHSYNLPVSLSAVQAVPEPTAAVLAVCAAGVPWGRMGRRGLMGLMEGR